MSRKGKTDTTLCANFCTYYKPGKNEELRCGGYSVVQRLRKCGIRLPPDVTGMPEAARPADMEHLKDRVCTGCAFRAADCDFMATGGTAAPCGGIAVLSHLLAAGTVTPAEITGDRGRKSLRSRKRAS